MVIRPFSDGGLVIECSLTVRKVMGSIPGLKTVKIGTRCHSAKHSVLKGRIEGIKTRDRSSAHHYKSSS